MAYLSLHLKVKPGTCFNYVSAVRYFLLNAGVDILFMDKNILLKTARTGILNHYHATHLVAEDRTLPLSCDMLLHGISNIFNTGSPQDDCIIAALVTARLRLLRCSEVLKHSISNHFLKECDIIFELSGHPNINFATSSDTSQELRNFVSKVNIVISSRKNDIYGSGHSSVFERHGVSSQGFDVVLILFDWSTKAKHKRGDPFFSYRQCWKLTYNMFNEAHKTIARSLGIDPTNFSTHSSRIGGACTLAAAGFPDSYILLAGGWSSLSFLVYIRLAMQKYQEG